MSASTIGEKVLTKIDAIDNRLGKSESAIEGLMKLVSVPASRAGLSPQEFIAKTTKGGEIPGVFGDDGAFHPTVQTGIRKRSLGKDWNELLFDLYKVRSVGANQVPDSVARLEKYGITKAALTESSGVTGGYTVPPMFAEKLMSLSLEDEIVEPRASRMQMTSKTLEVPSLDITTSYGAGITPFLGGVQASWTSEGATRAESEPQFRGTMLNAWELSFYAVASNNILADNAVGLDSLLTQLFSGAIGWYKDYAFFQGNGVGKPLGMINSPAAIQVNRTGGSSTIVSTDVAAMFSHLYFNLARAASTIWVTHQSCLSQVLLLSDQSGGTGSATNSGRFSFVSIDEGFQKSQPESGGIWTFGSLLGRPLFISEKVPALGSTGDLGLYDVSKYLLGQRMELQIDVSPHVKFLNNQMTWRVIWRGDGQPWLNGPITLADGVKTVSPFVLLH
jgi:HK97 family phage major capsid protein